MFLRHLDLTTALRPSLSDGESLLFVQNNVGLYEGKFKLEKYQNGSAYLTSRRVCYVDNEDPRKYAVAIDLKEVDRTEFYAGFLKSSPKITLVPKPTRPGAPSLRRPVPRQVSTGVTPPSSWSGSPSRTILPSAATSREVNATWICPICGLPNQVPANFDPSTANQHTPLPPCQACGIKPPLVLLVRASIAALSQRPSGTPTDPGCLATSLPDRSRGSPMDDSNNPQRSSISGLNICPRCTFENHASLSTCEVCGASLLQKSSTQYQPTTTHLPGSESPGLVIEDYVVGDETIEAIKLSFRNGGEKVFLERLRGALVQREWLLQSAPPVPRPNRTLTPVGGSPWLAPDDLGRSNTPSQRMVGIAGLERRGTELRENNQAVIGSAFEDLEALKTSAKEVIAMAEQFAKQINSGASGASEEAIALISDSASALGLVTTKDMLGSSSTSESLYITELARELAEFLTDNRNVLRKEGGIISLVDLWALFNSDRNGVELVSPLDCEKAATMWDQLHMPIRLRRFKSGLLVVQEKNRTDEKTIASLLAWLRESQDVFPPSEIDFVGRAFGRGVTALETAEKFGWKIGVAAEELEMAEEAGALCRDQSLQGIRFWENQFMRDSKTVDGGIAAQVKNLGI